MRKTFPLALGLIWLFSGCSASTNEAPLGALEKADIGDSPDASRVLKCTQQGAEDGLEVFDQGPVDTVSDEIGRRVEDMQRAGIELHRYLVKGTYTVNGADNVDRQETLEKVYVGRLYAPDGEVYNDSQDPAYKFGIWTTENELMTTLTVKIGRGYYANVRFGCEGDLPSEDEVVPVFPKTELTCKTVPPGEGQEMQYGGWVGEATLKFGVVALDDPAHMTLFWPEGEDENGDELSAVTVDPESSPVWTFESGIYNGYVEYLPGEEPDNGKLRMWSDDDGFMFGELFLFENSAYRAGYLKLEDGQDGSTSGSNIHCEHSDPTPAAQQ